MTSRWIDVSADGGAMPAYLAEPPTGTNLS